MASENLILILPDYYQITSDINANLLSEVKYMFVVWIMSWTTVHTNTLENEPKLVSGEPKVQPYLQCLYYILILHINIFRCSLFCKSCPCKHALNM